MRRSILKFLVYSLSAIILMGAAASFYSVHWCSSGSACAPSECCAQIEYACIQNPDANQDPCCEEIRSYFNFPVYPLEKVEISVSETSWMSSVCECFQADFSLKSFVDAPFLPDKIPLLHTSAPYISFGNFRVWAFVEHSRRHCLPSLTYCLNTHE